LPKTTDNGVTSNSSAATVEHNKDDAGCGQVTNVIVHAGVQQGEMGPAGIYTEIEIGCSCPSNFIIWVLWALSYLIAIAICMHAPGVFICTSGGVSYTLWGKTTCPTGRQQLYEGIMVGSHWRQGGSAAYICLHKQPQFLRTTPGRQGDRAYIYGTEYRATGTPPAFSSMVHHNNNYSMF
jgi:hypothetical protein